jgi:hypothetical protein
MTEQRRQKRVVFERGHPATIMAIDGTWRRPCTMEDVSDSGARLSIDGSIEGLGMTEFFPGAFNPGEGISAVSARLFNGNQVGVEFLRPGKKSTVSVP